MEQRDFESLAGHAHGKTHIPKRLLLLSTEQLEEEEDNVAVTEAGVSEQAWGSYKTEEIMGQ